MIGPLEHPLWSDNGRMEIEEVGQGLGTAFLHPDDEGIRKMPTAVELDPSIVREKSAMLVFIVDAERVTRFRILDFSFG